MKKSTFFAILVIIACVAIGYRIDNPRPKAEAPEVKWNKFLECSENEGDAGCDSCYLLIYGHTPDNF